MIMFCRIFLFFQYHNTVHNALRILSIGQWDHFSFFSFLISQELQAQTVIYLGFLWQMYRWHGDVLSLMISCEMCHQLHKKHEMAHFRPLY